MTVKTVFDRDGLLKRVDGDEALVSELIGLFLDDVPPRIETIRTALAAKDGKTVWLQAHTLGSAAGQMSAGRIHNAARALEAAGLKGDWRGMRTSFNRLVKAFDRFRALMGEGSPDAPPVERA